MKNYFQMLALGIFLVMIVASLIYVSSRYAHFFGMPGIISVIIFIALYVLAIGVMSSSLYVNGKNPFQHLLLVTGCGVAGVMIVLIFTLLAADLVNLIFHFKPLTEGIVVTAVTLVVSVFCFVNARLTRVEQIDIEIDDLDTPVKIAHLSDLHIGHFRGQQWLHTVVEITNQQKPDFVVITGDLYESHYNLDKKTVEELRNFEAPVYFVEGNHDIYVNTLRVKDMLKEIGVKVLENQKEEQSGIQLVGLNYMNADEKSLDGMHAARGSETMKTILPTLEIDPERPSILLHHNPHGVEYANANGIDLYLSGHTHGGQFFPATLVNHYLFKYNRGLYVYDKSEGKPTKVFVSDGLGTTGPPMRTFTKSEVSIINLKKKGH